MNYDPNEHTYARRQPIVPIAFLTALFTSLAVTVIILWLTGNLQSFKEANSKPGEELRAVPAVVGLTPEVAGDVLRARDFHFVVKEEKPDSEVQKGKIISQEPLPGSELKAGAAVAVTLSTGTPQVTVPSVIGEPLDKAKEKLELKKLVVGKVSETGEGEPGTVTATQPKAGETVEVGREIALTAVPSGKPVPKVVGMRFRKGKKVLKEAGFEVGEIKRRYDDNLDPGVILSQDPEAETTTPLESPVNLVLSD